MPRLKTRRRRSAFTRRKGHPTDQPYRGDIIRPRKWGTEKRGNIARLKEQIKANKRVISLKMRARKLMGTRHTQAKYKGVIAIKRMRH